MSSFRSFLPQRRASDDSRNSDRKPVVHNRTFIVFLLHVRRSVVVSEGVQIRYGCVLLVG